MRPPWTSIRKTITAELSSEHSDAGGSATLVLERSNNKLCFNLAWAGIGSPIAAHIHEGDGEIGGPAVLPLFVDEPKRSGCVKAHEALIGKISAAPCRYYIRLTTHRHPEGALRGQFSVLGLMSDGDSDDEPATIAA
jgi:hypothetical protein